MKKRNGFISTLLVIMVCVCALCVIRFLLAWSLELFLDSPSQSDPLNNPPYGQYQSYEIGPTTILADIKNEKTDIFPILPEDASVPRHPSGSFDWSSADYFEIAKAHHLFLTEEPASGEWKLFSPGGDFSIGQCSDDMKGFDSATIIFYKREPEAFPVTYIEIYPLLEIIDSANITYARMPDDNIFERIWYSPDTSFKEALSVGSAINAEKALQIAEEAGGAELRQRFSNNCDVRITYFTDDWVVRYYQSGTKLLTIDIDAKDGTYKIKQVMIK